MSRVLESVSAAAAVRARREGWRVTGRRAMREQRSGLQV